ncbi:MAG TPA: SAM-dependent methyltransferase [Gemmataceae bacterium]|nr:SAM-dependent methyltransferase [Gemmataceae bacterium]
MPDEPNPASTLAIILGASEFTAGLDALKGHASFAGSAKRFYEYLVSPQEFGLPKQNIVFLFDELLSSTEVYNKIITRIPQRAAQLKAAGSPPRDLLVYYVGHAGFSSDLTYCLSLKQTTKSGIYATGLPIAVLAEALNAVAGSWRKYIILDCCFAAEAFEKFQHLAGVNGPLEAAVQQTTTKLPANGTALLCAAPADRPADADPGRPPDADPGDVYAGGTYTMFSGALLEALEAGMESDDPRLSLSTVADLTRKIISERFGYEGVLPEVHIPRRAGGPYSQLGLADVGLFPNPAQVRPTSGGIYQALLEMKREQLGQGIYCTYCTLTDRARADELIRILPSIPEFAWMQRLSLRKIGAELQKKFGRQGLEAVVDFGSGYATDDHIHHWVSRETLVVYSDFDCHAIRVNKKLDLPENVRQFYADAREPGQLFSNPDFKQFLGGRQRIAIVFWGLSCFIDDDGLADCMRQLYDWCPKGGWLVFQAQIHEVDLEGQRGKAVRLLYRTELNQDLHVRDLSKYCTLLRPWKASPSDFIPVAELLAEGRSPSPYDPSTYFLDLQEYAKHAGVGSGVFIQKK